MFINFLLIYRRKNFFFNNLVKNNNNNNKLVKYIGCWFIIWVFLSYNGGCFLVVYIIFVCLWF